MNMTYPRERSHRIPLSLSFLAVAVLTACGGGTGTGDSIESESAAQATVSSADGMQDALAKRTTTPTTTTTTWTKVASEGASFTVGTNQRVRYGNGSSWIEKTVTGSGSCTTTFFRSDPAWGLVQECDVAGPAPAPAPAPAPTVGSVTATWVAPVISADGTTLTDLAGYRVYYGTASGTYSKSVTVTDRTATSYTIANLPIGTYFVTVTAFDASNNESARSPEVSKTIQ